MRGNLPSPSYSGPDALWTQCTILAVEQHVHISTWPVVPFRWGGYPWASLDRRRRPGRRARPPQVRGLARGRHSWRVKTSESVAHEPLTEIVTADGLAEQRPGEQPAHVTARHTGAMRGGSVELRHSPAHQVLRGVIPSSDCGLSKRIFPAKARASSRENRPSPIASASTRASCLRTRKALP